MKTTATELMKKLKFIEQDITNVHQNDEKDSYVPIIESTDEEGRKKLMPAYDVIYDFAGNRDRIKELYKEELEIKKILNEFNQRTLINGYDLTISEGLVRLGQLKSEVTVLTNITRRGKYIQDSYREGLRKATYDEKIVKDELRKAQHELSALQVAIDRTNLTIQIDY